MPEPASPLRTVSSYSSQSEVSRMIQASSVSPSGGSLSDTTENNNYIANKNGIFHPALVSGSKSDYYITKKEKLIPTSTSKTNLYIRGLNENTTDKDLHDMCQKFGEIKSTKAIIDKQTLKCKGYGFVDFKSVDDAKAALAELKKEQKDVQLAKQREQDPTNLYFANLPADIDEQYLLNMLKNRFSANVNSTRIMRERSGMSKGVGFARIDDDKLCEKIIQELNSKPFPDHSNKSKIISVKLADSGGILKPFSNTFHYYKQNHSNSAHSFINNNHSSIDNDPLNNSNSSSTVLALNDTNNNNLSASNLNLSINQTHPSTHHQYYPHTYQPPYLDSNFSSLPVLIDNYPNPSLIPHHPVHFMHRQTAPFAPAPPPPPIIPFPVQQVHHFYPGQGHIPVQGQMPYYFFQSTPYNQPYQVAAKTSENASTNTSTSTPSLNQQFANMNLANNNTQEHRN